MIRLWKRWIHEYKDTLNLPKTELPLKYDAEKIQANYGPQWTKDVYERQLKKKQGVENFKDWFIIHDGPPYANGAIHIGHALNKILKDTINRYQLMRGKKIFYMPGWDCHGLPIELKALEQMKKKMEKTEKLDTLEKRNFYDDAMEIRKYARQFAMEAIDEQRKQFKRLNILGDWEYNVFSTMDKLYEEKQLEVFWKMVERGWIYRDFKPVYWSPSSKTALAEAELEYREDHSSRAIYVKMKMKQWNHLYAWETKGWKEKKVFLIIWTTTPWTLPANKAIVVHPEMEYCLVTVETGKENEAFVIAKDLKNLVELTLGQKMNIVASCWGHELEGCLYENSWNGYEAPIILGKHVTNTTGTGLVHAAPAHGMDDYKVCMKYHLSPDMLVDETGRYTAEAGKQLQDQFVMVEGNDMVINELMVKGAILKEHSYIHKYPYDWRTKKPVLIRATCQWFARLTGGLQERALKALQDNVTMIPPVARHRMDGMITGRDDWCISRQRAWGVPIPVFYDKITDEPLLNKTCVDHIRNIFKEEGSDAWWSKDIKELLPLKFRNQSSCYRKGMDTMDVWFDSGTSWAFLEAELVKKGIFQPSVNSIENICYLEGSDQHRGWFQSSLLTFLASKDPSLITDKAPYSLLITHGFALDDHARKMSKSLGNIIEPGSIKDVDLLRLWVFSTDYVKDVTIGPLVLEKVADQMKKLRNTARFMLGNLYDFKDPVPYNLLRATDQWMLHELYQFGKAIEHDYNDFNFSSVFHRICHLASNQLSSIYFDIIKDRLYAESSASTARRAAQTVLCHILNVYLRVISPTLVHTAEEIYQLARPFLFNGQFSSNISVFDLEWYPLDDQWNNSFIADKIEILKSIRAEVNRLLDSARKDKFINNSLDVDLHIIAPSLSSEFNFLKEYQKELSSMCIVSQVHLHEESPHGDSNVSNNYLYSRTFTLTTPASTQFLLPILISIQPALLHKCPRCWTCTSSLENTLCPRCAHTLSIKT